MITRAALLMLFVSTASQANPVPYLWGSAEGASGKSTATCIELSTRHGLKVVAVSHCLEKLPVEYRRVDSPPHACLAYTPAGVEIQPAESARCDEVKPGASCPECRSKQVGDQALRQFLERIVLASNSEGGITSGGGDFDGAAAVRTLNAVIRAIEIADKGIYTPEQKRKLLDIARQLKIIVIDEELPVPSGTPKDGKVQKSAAFSFWGSSGPFALLQRERWGKKEDAIDREGLLHHELCVLAGIEETGKYHATSKYEEFRRKSWKFRDPDEAMICTTSLFKAAKSPGRHNVPGEAIGSGSIVLDGLGAKNGIVHLGSAGPKRDIRLLYVIDWSGYLRLKIVETDKQPKDTPFPIISNQTPLSEETVLLDPYGDPLYPGMGAKSMLFNGYFLSVSCTRE